MVTLSTEHVATQILSLPEELILMLLNEENGYFHQVPGWDLNCAVIGAVFADLSLSPSLPASIRIYSLFFFWIRQRQAIPPLTLSCRKLQRIRFLATPSTGSNGSPPERNRLSI